MLFRSTFIYYEPYRAFLPCIPPSGYIAPETIVPLLSTLSRLESLALGFQHHRSQAHRATRHPLPRVVLPNLTSESLDFNGNLEYLEDVLSQIETPVLNYWQSEFYFFNQLVFDTPILGHFIHRTETFKTIHTASVDFFDMVVVVNLFGPEEMAGDDREPTLLQISCRQLDWQLSAVAEVLNSFLSFLPTLETLRIGIFRDWQDEIEVIQWRELFRMFTSERNFPRIQGFNSTCRTCPSSFKSSPGKDQQKCCLLYKNFS